MHFKTVVVLLVAGASSRWLIAGPVDQSFFGLTPFGSQQLILTIGGTSTLVLNAIDTGWYDSTGLHSASNKDYFVGNTAASCVGGCAPFGPVFHDYFIFDLSSVTGTITGAQLSIGNPNWYVSPNPSETLAFWDVTTPSATLSAIQTGRTDILNDLGSGVLFGSRSISAADKNKQVVTNLNAAALAALNAGEGKALAFGGSLPSSEAPEPSTAILLLVGIGALGTLLAGRRSTQPTTN